MSDNLECRLARSPNCTKLISQVDMVKLGQYIISLCNGVKERFETEPRLLRLSTPCYILGKTLMFVMNKFKRWDWLTLKGALEIY